MSSKAKRDPYRLTGITLNGKYRLEEYAGGGGVGAVYRSINVHSGEQVAVKFLKPDIVVKNPEYVALFEREVQAVRHVNHPHIVKLLDSGTDQDISYMVMEWLDGPTLEEVISKGQLSIDRIRHIFNQICDAFAVAHDNNIIHLDVKPANIILLRDRQPDDFIKVIDFGMSRILTRESGTTVTRFGGTYQYCSPEHFGGKVSHLSDIYSLGATLYHLITGVLPFGTSYINAKRHPNLELPPIPSPRGIRPELPIAVEEVIEKSLSRNPKGRQASARELFEDFSKAVRVDTTQPIQKPSTGLTHLYGAFRHSLKGAWQKSPAKTWFLGILAVLMIGSVVGTRLYFYSGKDEHLNNSNNQGGSQQVALQPSPIAIGAHSTPQTAPTAIPSFNASTLAPRPTPIATSSSNANNSAPQPTPTAIPSSNASNSAPEELANVSSLPGGSTERKAPDNIEQPVDATNQNRRDNLTETPALSSNSQIKKPNTGSRPPLRMVTNELGDGKTYECYLAAEDVDYSYYNCYTTSTK